MTDSMMGPETPNYGFPQLTSLAYQQKEPDAPGQVEYKRNSVAGAPKQSHNAEEDLGNLPEDPRLVWVCD